MPDNQSAPSALDGLRVLDLGLLVQAPQAAQLLGDLGADVIKVELPGMGDQSRWIPVSPDDRRAAYFIGCNRGKRSITIDLRTDAGRDVFLRLADTADVIVSNFLPGTLDRWGLSYEAVSARNPRIVYACGSTFGPEGPDADRKGADLAGQAAGGLIRRTGPDNPTPVGVTIADHIGSQNMCNGVLAALLVRERTGRGQRVDVSLLGGQIFAQASEYTYTFLTGENPGDVDRGHPLLLMTYGIFATADGYIAIVGVQPPMRKAFFDAIERPELTTDPRFDAPLFTPEQKRAFFDTLEPTFRTRTTADWEQRLRAAGQRYAAVREYTEVAADPGVFENGYLQRVEGADGSSELVVGCPIRLSETPTSPGTTAPELGQHTEEILLEIGLEWPEIEDLRSQNAI